MYRIVSPTSHRPAANAIQLINTTKSALAEPVIKDTKRKNGSGHDTAEQINYISKTGQHLEDPLWHPF